MILKELGATGERVPELAQGTWGYKGGVDALRQGLDLGCRFIDAAEAYRNETIVGEAIQGVRSEVFLASKVSPLNFRYEAVIKAAELSLARLKTDYLDLYQLHWPNYTIPLSETMAAMEKLVESGKVRFIGVCNFSVDELQRAQQHLSNARIVANQVRYSLLDRSPEQELLPYCEANGISLLAYSPLGTGMSNIVEADKTNVLGRLAGELNKTMAQVALNWCISHPSIIAIYKAQQAEHVRENCAASGWYLTGEQRLLLANGVIPKLSRGPLERTARRFARRFLQHVGRDVGISGQRDE